MFFFLQNQGFDCYTNVSAFPLLSLWDFNIQWLWEHLITIYTQFSLDPSLLKGQDCMHLIAEPMHRIVHFLSIFLAEAYIISHGNVCRDWMTEPWVPVIPSFSKHKLNTYSVPVPCWPGPVGRKWRRYSWPSSRAYNHSGCFGASKMGRLVYQRN